MIKLKEIFSNWEYRLPKDPELLMYDFYFLFRYAEEVDIAGNEAFNYNLKKAANLIINHLSEWMYFAIDWAIESEIYHVHRDVILLGYDEDEEPYDSPKRKNPQPQVSPLAVEYVVSHKSLSIFTKRKKLSNIQKMSIAEELFSIENAWSIKYGGEPWARIAHAGYMLLSATTLMDKAVWIDHAYDLEHNNDSFFDKIAHASLATVKKYYHLDIGKYVRRGDPDDYNFEWLQQALDWKRDIEDLRGYYYKVSPTLKPVVAYVLKQTGQGTIEGYVGDYEKKKGEWENMKKKKSGLRKKMQILAKQQKASGVPDEDINWDYHT